MAFVEIAKRRRKAFVDALKTTTLPQTTENQLEHNGSYCAIGIGMLAAEMPVTIDSYMDFRTYYGLTIHDSSYIWNLNDVQKMSFPEIAEQLEKRWELV